MSEEDESRQRMEQWVKETESRRRRRPREHRMSREEMKETAGFQRRLTAGKSSEKYVAEKFLIMHFDTVQDISMEEFSDWRGRFYSPFDLLVTNCCFRFLVDVKRRSYRVPIGIPVKKLDDYESLYSEYSTRNKLIVFHFPMTTHQDLFYITIKDIREVCHIVGPFYHIEMHQLTSLVGKALVNTLEPYIAASEILEKYERDL